jgi:hypothetical protein
MSAGLKQEVGTVRQIFLPVVVCRLVRISGELKIICSYIVKSYQTIVVLIYGLGLIEGEGWFMSFL